MVMEFVLPIFVTVMVVQVIVPTRCCLEKNNILLVRSSDPMPVTVTVWGLLGSLSTTVMVAERGPALVGTNLTPMKHGLPGGTLCPTHPHIWKSDVSPLIFALVTVSSLLVL